MRGLTAALSMESFGWKLLGPSSQMYPSPATDVMFPPTRSRPSVTMNLKAEHSCQSPGSVTCLVRPKVLLAHERSSTFMHGSVPPAFLHMHMPVGPCTRSLPPPQCSLPGH
jgi:hypothetical protein